MYKVLNEFPPDSFKLVHPVENLLVEYHFRRIRRFVENALLWFWKVWNFAQMFFFFSCTTFDRRKVLTVLIFIVHFWKSRSCFPYATVKTSHSNSALLVGDWFWVKSGWNPAGVPCLGVGRGPPGPGENCNSCLKFSPRSLGLQMKV